MKPRALAVACAIAVTSCTTAGAGGPAPGQPDARYWTRREDRVVVGSFANVTGVAAGERYLFAASSSVLAVFDRLRRSWLLPLPLDGNIGASRATVVVADPVDDAAWVGLAGALLYYRPAVDHVATASVPGQVDVIMFDARDPASDAYVRISGQWSRASRSGTVIPVGLESLPPPGARRLPPSLQDIYREYPALQRLQSLLTREERSLWSWPVTVGAKAPSASEVWLGTRGGGLYRVDPTFNRAERVPFGLAAEGAGAVAIVDGDVWVAGAPVAGAPSRGALTVLSADLQRWRWVDYRGGRELAPLQTNDLALRGSAIWLATDRGVVRVDARDDRIARAWTVREGLPSDQVLSLAPAETGAWAGTARGVVFLSDSAPDRPATRADVSSVVADGIPVRALALSADTLWIGSDAGLLRLRIGSPDPPQRVSAAAGEPRLARPIRALARSDSVALVVTPGELVLVDVRTGRALPRPHTGNVLPLSEITAAVIDDRSIWVTGTGGVLVITRATGVSRFLAARVDIPSDAFDVALDRDYGWVATRGGLLRLRRLTDGSIP